MKYFYRYRLLIVIYGLAVLAGFYELGFLQRPAATVSGLGQPSPANDILIDLYPGTPMTKCLEADRAVFLNYDLVTAKRLLEDALRNGCKEDASYFYTYATILMLMNEDESTVREAVANWRRHDLTTNDQLDPRVAYKGRELPASLDPNIVSSMTPVRNMAMSRDGRQIVVGCQDQVLRVFDTAFRRFSGIPKAHATIISAVGLAANDTRAVSASLAGDLAVWDMTNGKLVHRMEGHRSDIYGLAVFPDGIRCATVDRDGMARIWDLQEGKSLVEFMADERPVSAVAVSADSSLLATGNWFGEIRLWSLQGNRPTELQRLAGHRGLVSQLIFTPDSKRLVSSSRDQTARIWNIATAKTESVLAGHGAPIYGLDVSPDGKQVVTASEDRRVKIWSVEKGAVLQSLATRPRPRPLYAVLFAYDNQTVIWDNGVDGLEFAGAFLP